jgi:tryptophan synthase alpha chain
MIRGKEKIAKTFAELKARGEKGLVTYITGGYPNIKTNLAVLKELADSGSDLIEIGIPFSDPIADGPVIQRASYIALSNGVKIDDILKLVEDFREYSRIPVILMTYYNPVYRSGLENFVSKAVRAGVDGLIIPDLPIEEDNSLRKAALTKGLALIPLAAPTSTEERLKKIADKAEGFIYCVAVTGVTGTRKEITTDIDSFTGKLKKLTDIPLVVGFGISGPESAAKMAFFCDGIVVGSLIVDGMKENESSETVAKTVGRINRSIKDGITVKN